MKAYKDLAALGPADWDRVLQIAQELAQIRTAAGVELANTRDGRLVSEFMTITGRLVPPVPFKTDGCTFSTDAFGKNCCVLHDVKYWIGGTRADRWRADADLYECTRQNSELYAAIQWLGVRIFAGPSVPLMNARWGYGWPYPEPGEPEVEY